MKKYTINTILVPLDYTKLSEKALSFAITLAKKCKAKLILINVVEMPTFAAPDGNYADLTYVISEQMKNSKEYLRQLTLDILNEHGIEAEYQTAQGYIYDNIIRAAHITEADLIVMGTGRMNGLSDTLLGSNAFRVVNNSPVPVLTIHEDQLNSEISKIVFPVSEDKYTMEKAYEVIAFARLYHSEIHLLGILADPLKYYMLDENILEVEQFFEEQGLKIKSRKITGKDYVDAILQYCENDTSILVSIASKQDHRLLSMFKQKHDEKLVNMAVVPVLSVPLAA
ncbi:MAG: universal stress protein [Bacteroidetes bacterium]|nr:universal stress protein [Bacteroidota bacterium]